MLSIWFAFLLVPWTGSTVGIGGLVEERPLDGASLARVDSSRACPGMVSGLAIDIDMMESYETCF